MSKLHESDIAKNEAWDYIDHLEESLDDPGWDYIMFMGKSSAKTGMLLAKETNNKKKYREQKAILKAFNEIAKNGDPNDK